MEAPSLNCEVLKVKGCFYVTFDWSRCPESDLTNDADPETASTLGTNTLVSRVRLRFSPERRFLQSWAALLVVLKNPSTGLDYIVLWETEKERKSKSKTF